MTMAQTTGHDRHSGDDHHAADAGKSKDPVCGMDVPPQSAARAVSHAGETYYFCSNGCASKFESDPQKYIGNKTEPRSSSRTGTEYTCPMHPEIVRDHPGTCPICGTALEPRSI